MINLEDTPYQKERNRRTGEELIVLVIEHLQGSAGGRVGALERFRQLERREMERLPGDVPDIIRALEEEGKTTVRAYLVR